MRRRQSSRHAQDLSVTGGGGEAEEDASSDLSLPSGFWPPPQPAQPSPKLAKAVSFTRKGTTTLSSNPHVLGAATVEVDAAEVERGMSCIEEGEAMDSAMTTHLHVQIPSVASSATTLGVSPSLRQRARKIMNSRRITSPITRHTDIVWQEHPSRILKYRASNLHTYGWIPFLNWRNRKATVLGNPKMYLQTAILMLWMALVHWTGLGASTADLQAFVLLFGTPYLGAIFNIGTIVTFVLGLFVTLVINRWWSMRAVYANLASNTVDVVTMMVTVIRNPNDADDYRTKRARTELLRLLNLGHLLVLTQADGQSRHFAQSLLSAQLYERTLGRLWKALKMSESSQEADDGNPWQKAVRDISFLDLSAEGLVNVDEWKHIIESERRGMPRYLLAYHWTRSLLHQLHDKGWIYNGPQSLPAMLNKITGIIDAGAQIFTYINSQLPYPYVHLVSLVVHSYLWLLATYLGALLYGGIDDSPNLVGFSLNSTGGSAEDMEAMVKGAQAGTAPSMPSSVLIGPPETFEGKIFCTVFLYYFLALATITFKGLLDIHTLLDNPFGRHCAKFPLRAQITELMNTCRSMLQTSEMEPECFADIFLSDDADPSDPSPLNTSAEARAPPRPRPQPHLRNGSADFLAPKGRPVQIRRSSLSPTKLSAGDSLESAGSTPGLATLDRDRDRDRTSYFRRAFLGSGLAKPPHSQSRSAGPVSAHLRLSHSAMEVSAVPESPTLAASEPSSLSSSPTHRSAPVSERPEARRSSAEK